MPLCQKTGQGILMKNNKYGVTLIEVAVAVLIFSAAIVPLYYALSYGARSEIDYEKVAIANKILESFRDEALALDYDDLAGLINADASTSWSSFTTSSLPPRTFEELLAAQTDFQDFTFSGQVRTPPDALVESMEIRAEISWTSSGPPRDPEQIFFIKVKRQTR